MARPIPYGSGGGGKGGGSGGYVPSEQPNNLQSNSVVRLVDLISEGTILGLVDGDKSIYLDDVALQNSDGSYNFSGVNYELKTGTPNQTHLAGFPSIESEIAVGQKVTVLTPVVKSVTNANADAIRLTVRIPALSFQNPDNGDLQGSELMLAIDVMRNGGGFVEVLQDTITGKTTSPYDRSYRITLPANGAPWTIRLRRITPDSTQSNLVNDLYWASYTEIVDNKISYADSAVVGLTLNAKQFGTNVPTRSYDIYGLVIKVPSNYNPTTRVYSGVWDGTFKLAWTDNPAWVFYDLLTNDRYGLGEFITAEQVDAAALYRISQYCDELVPDGFGGMEPRFVLNTVISSREEAYNVVQAVASAFRGMTYWASGAVTVAQDSPKDATRIVAAANVINGQFDYAGTSLKARHTVCMVTWNDPEDSYRRAIEVVEDSEAINKYGWRQTDVIAYGCTSRGQAHRFGKWILDSEKNETQTVTYRAGLDHADVLPCEVVLIQDSHYAGIDFGGRVVSATTSEVTLDRPVQFTAGQSYTLSVQLPNGALEDRAISNGAGQHTVINLASPLPMAPSTQAMWAISGTDVSLRPFKVLSNKENEKHQFEIVAMEYDATKFARVEQGITLASQNFSAIPTGPLLSPTGLAVTEYVYQAGTSIKSALTLSWSNPSDARIQYFDVEVKDPTSAVYTRVAQSSRPSADILDTQSGLYSFRVRAIGLGLSSPWSYLENINVFSVAGPPADVQGLNLRIIGPTMYLSWDRVQDLDLDHYVIKYSSQTTGADWSTSTILIASVPLDTTTVPVPSMIGTYLIKAVDAFGTESVNATLIVNGTNALDSYNAVEQLVEHPSFAGTKDSGVVVVSDELTLDPPTLIQDYTDISAVTDLSDTGGIMSGFYYFDNDLDLGQTYTSRVTPFLKVRGSDIYSTFNSYPIVNDVENIAQTVGPATYRVRVDIRFTSDDPSGSPTWTDWTELTIGDYTARAFQFRVFLESLAAGVIPVVEQLSVTVDMPDRVSASRNVSISSGGTAILFEPPFKATPAIAVSAVSLATGDYYEITGASRNGFTIRFFNAAGTGISKTMDWVAKGYGYET